MVARDATRKTQKADRVAAGHPWTEAGRGGAITGFVSVACSRHRPAETATSGKTVAGGSATMSKPTKTQAELIQMARAELKVHADCPDGIAIFVLRSEESWEFRTEANEVTIAKPGYPECVAMIVQIGDHLSKQYDVSG